MRDDWLTEGTMCVIRYHTTASSGSVRSGCDGMFVHCPKYNMWGELLLELCDDNSSDLKLSIL